MKSNISSLYDVDGNGWVDLEEMTRIVQSIKMMGQTGHQEKTPEENAEDIFNKMDLNSVGRVTRQEFVQACINDSVLLGLLAPNTRYLVLFQD